MMNKLQSLVGDKNSIGTATKAGKAMHIKLQNVFFFSNGAVGDSEIVKKLSTNSELCEYMGRLSKTEVPIAGFVDGVFISRRIDRLYVNPQTKKIVVLDYKTDRDHQRFLEKYIEQLIEYRDLLKQIYPGFDIQCKILWTHDFTLENII